MASRLTLRIQERLAQLTPSERKLGVLLMEQPELVDTHNATELANGAGISKATAARFFRSLGYRDFDQVKTQAREERNRTEPYQHLSVASSASLAHGRAIGDHLELEMVNLRRTFEEMHTNRVAQAVTLLAEAPRVWFLAEGLEEGLARQGRILFSRLRPGVQQLGSHDGAWVEDLAMTGAGDALVLISLEHRSRLQQSIIDYAGTTHMNMITLTDHLGMATAQRHSRVVLPCHVASYSKTPSHTAITSVLRLLALSYSGLPAHAAAVTQRLDIINQIHEELDDRV